MFYFTCNHGFKSGGLQSVVSNAGEGLQRADQGRRRTAFAYRDTAVRQWRTRLRACVKAKGVHFEHKLSQ